MSISGVQFEVYRSGTGDNIVIRFSLGKGKNAIAIARAYCQRMLKSLQGNIEDNLAESIKKLTGVMLPKTDELITRASQAIKIETMLMSNKGRRGGRRNDLRQTH